MGISQATPFGSVVQAGARSRFLESVPINAAPRRAASPDALSQAAPREPAPVTPAGPAESPARRTQTVTGPPKLKTSRAVLDLYA